MPSLLRSAHALLQPNGICLISVSSDPMKNDSSSFESVSMALSRWPDRWSDSAWGLSDLARTDKEFKDMASRLAGRTLLDEKCGCVLQVTEPSCQFEFFRSQADIIALIEDAGFNVKVVHADRAVDYSGLSCNRIRMIARPV
jgi:hypothetical protein